MPAERGKPEQTPSLLTQAALPRCVSSALQQNNTSSSCPNPKHSSHTQKWLPEHHRGSRRRAAPHRTEITHPGGSRSPAELSGGCPRSTYTGLRGRNAKQAPGWARLPLCFGISWDRLSPNSDCPAGVADNGDKDAHPLHQLQKGIPSWGTSVFLINQGTPGPRTKSRLRDKRHVCGAEI